MKTGSQLLGAVLMLGIAVLATTACVPVATTTTYSTPSCSQLLESAIAYERYGNGDINSTMQSLSDNCSDEYEIAVDYLANSSDRAFSIDSCEELLHYGTREESVALIEQDGGCSFGEAEVDTAPEWPDDGLAWDRAGEYAGTVQRVCGPLMSDRVTDDGTFINIGEDYPSHDRFTIIFWNIYLDPIGPGATVCGTGEIYLYEGVAQMEMWDPNALEIWR